MGAVHGIAAAIFLDEDAAALAGAALGDSLDRRLGGTGRVHGRVGEVVSVIFFSHERMWKPLPAQAERRWSWGEWSGEEKRKETYCLQV